MSPALTIGLSLLAPVVGAVLVALTGKKPNLRESMTGLASLVTIGLVLTLVGPVMAGEQPEWVVVDALLPGVPLAFRIEPLGMLYALVAAGLWPVTSAYAVGYMRGHHETNQTRFYVCFALAISAALGIAFAANLVTLFLFYEVLTLSTYPLVTHHQNAEARQSGRVYLGILMGTSVGFLLLAIAWTYAKAGTLDFRPGGILAGHIDPAMLPLLLGLFAYGSGKAALMPLHRWLPAAMVAPTPVSALLHAVAVVKAGVFTVLKVVVYVFGIDLLHDTGASEWLMWVATFTLIMGSLVAFRQDNLKARLAYSTVSQLAYIVLGAALVTPEGIIGGGLHIATHAVGKITLFFCAGAILVAAHKKDVSELDGLGRTMPLTMGAFFVASLSIIGVPPLGGSWSKWYLALGAADEHAIFVAALMVSSLLNIGYLIPIPIRAFFFPTKDEDHAHHEPGAGCIGGDGPLRGEVRWLCVVPLCLTAAGCVALFFLAHWVVRLVAPIVGVAG